MVGEQMKRLGSWLILILVASLFCAPLVAQKTSGTIRGVVTDPSGAAVASVTVTVTSGCRRTFTGRFQSERRDHQIAQSQKCVNPAGSARHHPDRGLPGVQGLSPDGDTIRIDELRAGEHFVRIAAGGNFLDRHARTNLFASRRNRNTRSMA